MSEKIIRFPGAAGRVPGPAPVPTPPPAPAVPVAGLDAERLRQAQQVLGSLTEEQQKALQVVMSGMSFVLVGIRPTDRGADFFTAVHGDATDLRNAQPHLDGVIARAYARKGI